MKRLLLVIATAIAIVLLAPQQAHAGKPAGGATLTLYQGGAPTTQLNASEPFEIRGTGFRSSYTVLVCFSGDHCLHSDVDGFGEFTQLRSMQAPGLYTVSAQQARNRQMGSWQLKASVQISVVN